MIRKIGVDKFKIEVDIGFDSYGKRQRVYETFYGLKKDAKLRENEIKKSIKLGTYINSNKLTFRELGDMFIQKYAMPNLAEKTVSVYLQQINKICEYIGTIPIQKINTITLIELYEKIKNSEKSKKLTNNTILHYYNLMNSVLNFGVSLQLLPINVNLKIPRPKVIKKEAKCYDCDETLKLIKCLSNEPLKYQALIMLALDSGARRGELIALEWSDINFETHSICINKSIGYVDKKIIEKETKNFSSNRIITITDSTIKILEAYKKEQERKKLLLGVNWRNTNKVFTQENGEIMFPDTAGKIFSKIIKKYNLRKITFHQLRHTSASLQIYLGISGKQIANRLGHSSTSTTLNIYSHIFKAYEEESANKLEGLFTSSNV